MGLGKLLRKIPRAAGKAGKVLGKVGKIAGNIGTGGLAGTALGLATSALQRKSGGRLPAFGGIGGPGGFTLPGFGLIGGGNRRIEPQDGQCPKGYHLNKSTTADGLPPRSICVRNRSMNASNGRAIARAARRLTRAKKQYRKVLTILGAPAKGKIVPKRRG